MAKPKPEALIAFFKPIFNFEMTGLTIQSGNSYECGMCMYLIRISRVTHARSHKTNVSVCSKAKIFNIFSVVCCTHRAESNNTLIWWHIHVVWIRVWMIFRYSFVIACEVPKRIVSLPVFSLFFSFLFSKESLDEEEEKCR